MECSGCGNKSAFRINIGYCNNEQGEKVKHEICDECGKPSSPWIPDVFFDGKLENNLVDKQGNKVTFGSKREKAIYLKQNNMNERGDKIHGSHWSPEYRRNVNRNDLKNDARMALSEAIREVKQRRG